MEAFSGGLFSLLFLQWNRSNACARWRALGGFYEAKTKLWACGGESPGSTTARLQKPGLRSWAGLGLSAFGFRLATGADGTGLIAAGWRRLFRQAACKLPVSSATVCAASRSCSKNRPDFAPALIAAKSLKPCDGGVFRGSFFAPVFAVAKAGADRVLKTKKARRGAGLSGQRCRAL